jgi:hypothetical protein
MSSAATPTPVISTVSLLASQKMAQKTVSLYEDTEDCQCYAHSLISPASNQHPPCKFAEQPSLYETPLPFGEYPDKYVRKMDPTILVKIDGFAIERGADPGGHGLGATWDSGISWITHLCPAVFWKIVIDSQWALKNEVCFSCNTEIPTGIIALWKMHNFDKIKNIANQPQIHVDLMETEAEWDRHFGFNRAVAEPRVYTSPYDLVGTEVG